MYQGAYMESPILLFLSIQGPQHTDESLVKPLDLPVPLRVIWCGAGLPNSSQAAQLFDKLGFKVSPLVCVEALRKTIVDEELLPQYLGNRLRLLVLCWERLVLHNLN